MKTPTPNLEDCAKSLIAFFDARTTGYDDLYTLEMDGLTELLDQTRAALQRQNPRAAPSLDSERIRILAYNPDCIDLQDYDENPDGLRRAIDAILERKEKPMGRQK